ncbi:21415_t:CDS:2 [Rhizophagus irregularis]|nr:21415_t:CDS:2 [Rhizophagus irregularis]
MERKPRSKISKQSKKYTFISKQHNVWTTRLRTRATEYKQQNIKNSKGPRWEVVNEGEDTQEWWEYPADKVDLDNPNSDDSPSSDT